MLFKNKNTISLNTFFVTILTLSVFMSCKTTSYTNYKIEGKKIPITSEFKSDKAIDTYVEPYRSHINKDLDSVLSYCPVTLDKFKGEYQTNIGDFIADACVELANPIFYKREQKNIDGAIFNHGGIRTIIPQGNITKRTAYEVMPFENTLIVVALKGNQLMDIASYFIKEKKPHPLYGFHIYLNNKLEVTKMTVNDKPIDVFKTYYILTSDYLSNGGDNMVFFLKNEGKYDLNYKMRNVLIDYFTKHKSIEAKTKPRVTKE